MITQEYTIVDGNDKSTVIAGVNEFYYTGGNSTVI